MARLRSDPHTVTVFAITAFLAVFLAFAILFRTLYLAPTQGRSLIVRLQNGRVIHLASSSGWYIYDTHPLQNAQFFLMYNSHAADGSCVDGVPGEALSVPPGATAVQEQTIAYNPHACESIAARTYTFAHR